MALFKCAVFDLDGTLIDTSKGLISSIRYTINYFGLPKLDEDTIKSFIGPPIQNSFRKQYGFPENQIKEIAAVFREHYKNADLLKAKPYDGIFDVFMRLQNAGVEVAIATYKRQDYAFDLLQYLGFCKYTDHIFGSDFEGKLKKKDIIELALKHTGVQRYSDAVMIGDSDNDAVGAREIGAAFLGVTYGFGFKRQEEVIQFGPIGVAETVADIAKYIIGGE